MSDFLTHSKILHPFINASGEIIGFIDSGHTGGLRALNALDGSLLRLQAEYGSNGYDQRLTIEGSNAEFAGNVVHREGSDMELQDETGTPLARQASDFIATPYTTNADACNKQLDQEADNYFEEYINIWSQDGFLTIQRDSTNRLQSRLQGFLP